MLKSKVKINQKSMTPRLVAWTIGFGANDINKYQGSNGRWFVFGVLNA